MFIEEEALNTRPSEEGSTKVENLQDAMDEERIGELMVGGVLVDYKAAEESGSGGSDEL